MCSDPAAISATSKPASRARAPDLNWQGQHLISDDGVHSGRWDLWQAVFGLSQGTQVVSKILVRETGLLFLLFTTPVIQPIPLA